MDTRSLVSVVDDDKDIREMLRFVLEQEAGNIIAVGSVMSARRRRCFDNGHSTRRLVCSCRQRKRG